MKKPIRTDLGPHHCRGGFTLFEILVALGLVATLFSLLGMAIHLHLRAVGAGRNDVETALLARNLLDLLAKEVRSAVVRVQADEGSPGASSGAEGGGAAETSGAEPDDGRGGGDEPTSRDPDREPAGDDSMAAQARPTPGLYGTQDQIQFDLAYLPRLEPVATSTAGPARPGSRPTAVRTVSYLVREAAGSRPANGALGVASDPDARGGLVRRQIERSVLVAAVARAGLSAGEVDQQLLAPEVTAIEFRYWDGTEWTTSWDTSLLGGLPLAVEVAIAIGASGEDPYDAAPSASPSGIIGRRLGGDEVYRRLINLPTAVRSTP